MRQVERGMLFRWVGLEQRWHRHALRQAWGVGTSRLVGRVYRMTVRRVCLIPIDDNIQTVNSDSTPCGPVFLNLSSISPCDSFFCHLQSQHYTLSVSHYFVFGSQFPRSSFSYAPSLSGRGICVIVILRPSPSGHQPEYVKILVGGRIISFRELPLLINLPAGTRYKFMHSVP
jgi:hypothetical protein